MKITVIRKKTSDKVAESILCLCMALFMVAVFTLGQTAYYENLGVSQPLYRNLYFCGILGGLSGFIGCAVSLVQTVRKKPLMKYKFVSENKEVTLLFLYIASYSIIWVFLVKRLEQISLSPTKKLFSFEVFSLVHPYLLFAFILFMGLISINLYNVMKSLSLNTPRRTKKPN